MDITPYHDANRLAWNEAAGHYEREIEDDIAFLLAGGKNLMPPELIVLHDLGKWCRRAVHLQCSGGLDTLSLWNQGASEVVGIDISERMIGFARRKSEALSAPALWYAADVLETPHELDATADLVYTGRGALFWLLDIDAWADTVKRLLKPGGWLYVFEGHPLDWVWDPNATQFRLVDSYFSSEIDESRGWPENFLPEDDVIKARSAKYGHQWTLGAIVTALANKGLRLELLEEHPIQYWNGMPNLPLPIANQLPHTFSLLMRNI